ncbi:MAG: formate C-acetyltransferase/glycerol dehydratase family glycyl radical enzyme, partial [Firmicutes bacterium]|nr:formate C-acetyltransferase/glycerol dehydratase family glycyl radical enzyme [Bacillota bacterium]
PMQGTDTEGPTSVMGAALSLAQEKCAGTCVLNLRLDPANFRTAEGCAKVQQLFQAYFLQGGSQLQVNVVDPQRLIDAMKDPENHRDIIVRVGGFSDNFVMLSKAIQQEVLKRVQHTV